MARHLIQLQFIQAKQTRQKRRNRQKLDSTRSVATTENIRIYLRDSAWQNCRALIVNSESELRCCKDFEEMSPKEQKKYFRGQTGDKVETSKTTNH